MSDVASMESATNWAKRMKEQLVQSAETEDEATLAPGFGVERANLAVVVRPSARAFAGMDEREWFLHLVTMCVVSFNADSLVTVHDSHMALKSPESTQRGDIARAARSGLRKGWEIVDCLIVAHVQRVLRLDTKVDVRLLPYLHEVASRSIVWQEPMEHQGAVIGGAMVDSYRAAFARGSGIELVADDLKEMGQDSRDLSGSEAQFHADMALFQALAGWRCEFMLWTDSRAVQLRYTNALRDRGIDVLVNGDPRYN